MKQKTRTNQPVYPEVEFPVIIEVSNIKQLTDAQINGLQAGDIVAKKTGNQYHSYIVSYKENGQGICLTYTDASCVETVSYDLVGGHWVYNSTDITPIAEPLMENVVDKDGHKRFIEGTIDIQTVEGVTKTYGKWSLSGTHLMIVVCCSFASGEYGYISSLAQNFLPTWILDKINVFGTNYIANQSFSFVGSDNSIQTGNAQLRKDPDRGVFISVSSITLTADRQARIAFDLLIDNEQPVEP